MRTFLFALLVSAAFVGIVGRAAATKVDSPFAVYSGNLAWEDEVVFLDNFAIYLKRHPEMIGYVGFYSDARMSRRKLEDRMDRSIRYLRKTRKIPKGRVQARYLGIAEDSQIVLQPLNKDKNPPWY